MITPLSQALDEGIISRPELKHLMRRRNGPTFFRLILWVLLIAFTSALVVFSLDSWTLVPAMTLHGIVLVHHFSLQHECCHYTPFKTRWLNDWVGNLCGLIIMLPNRFFRYEHCDHHTFTQLQDKDPEMIPMPGSWSEYLFYLSSIPYWKSKFSEIGRHAAGRISRAESRFIPKSEVGSIILEARLMLLFYAGVIATCVIFDWWAPVWFWWLPVMLGEPFMRAIRMTEHVGRPTVAQMSDNTRTNIVSKPLQFLCWNMNFHAEHHYASSVPYHALPKLHRRLKDHLYTEPAGYIGAHRAIIRALQSSGQSSEKSDLS